MRFLCIFLVFISHLPHVYWSCDHFDIHCTYICFIYYWGMFFHLSFHMLSLFYLYTHVSYIMYAIYSLCFTLRCLDEFYLKCFKSLCKDRFYYIQQVNMSWMIYDFSHISFICCSFDTDCQMGRLLGHVWFNVRNICQHFM